MKRSSFRSFALAACALAISAAAYAAAPVAAACRFVAIHVAAAFGMAAPATKIKQLTPSWCVKGKAFAGRLAKRERPLLTSTWRMCPSV